MKLRVFIGLVTLAAALSRPSAANDATFGGSGADLVPLAEQQVQMKSEDVRLTSKGWDWLVEANYVFFNPGADVKVQVGFPEYRCEPDSDCANVAFRELETRVDGALVQHRQGKLEKGQSWADFLGVVWLFDVHFPAGKEVRVQHRYRLSSGANVEGDLYTSYVTRTGRGWAGPIGRAKFTAVFPPYARVVYDPAVKGLSSTGPKLITDGGDPRVELVLSGENWMPEGGLTFTYNGSAQLSLEPINTAALASSGRPPMVGPCNPGQDIEEVQRCMNELYASKGYPFKNTSLSKQYYSGNPAFRLVTARDQRLWVRDASPLAQFSPSWFLSTEARQIKDWSAQIAREREASAGKDPKASEVVAATAELPAPAAAQTEAPAPRAAILRAGSGPAKEQAPQTEPVATRAAPTATAAGSTATPSNAAPEAAAPRQTAQCGCRVAAPANTSNALGLATLFGLLALRRWRHARC